jgi:hypothetical protein
LITVLFIAVTLLRTSLHDIYDMIYLLTAVLLSPGGSTHLHTNNTRNNTNNNRTTRITTNVEECGPCPVFASFTLAFALQLRKKHEKTSVRERKTSQVTKNLSQSTVYILPKTPTHLGPLTILYVIGVPFAHLRNFYYCK